MKKSNLRATAALQALALLGAGVPVAFFAAAPAAAQDYTSGVLAGTVRGANGAVVPGATVTVRSEGQGFTRTTTTGADGRFTFSQLPAGIYDVIVQSAGNPNYRADDVEVQAGRTAEIPVDLTPAAADVATAGGGEIVVVGRRVQTFEGTETGLNVDVEELTQTVPVGRNLTSVVLLAPSTSSGDSAFGNLASIGGASVAENAYYVNGLNITNFDNYLGSAQVPFDFYKSVDVKSGGYPAEFGRATGGIISATTKRGTNNWEGAVHVNWAPDRFRADAHELQTCNDVDESDDDPLTQQVVCENLTNRSEDYSDSLSAVVELGGPIFRDRLFVYGLVELRDVEYQNVNRISGTAFRYKTNDPFWGAKIDAFPLDNHHLQFTMFDTRNTLTRDDIAYSEDADGDGIYGLSTSTTAFNGGGFNYVGQYTGRLTDFLTVSGAYGRMRDRFDNVGIAGAAGAPYFINASGVEAFGVDYLAFYNGQRIQSVSTPYDTERKFYRGDVDVLVDFFGNHHFRAGFDVENNTLVESAVRSGNTLLCSTGFLTVEACTFGAGGAGAALLVRPGEIVEVNYFNSGGAFDAKNTAIYLQDEWAVNDRLTINAGIRRDNFAVNSSNGDAFATLKDNWAPRIGLTYDVLPDQSGKIKAFYGRYFLPFASNTAFRMTGTEYYFRERFQMLGLDANGLPILGPQITNNASYQAACPFALTPVSSGQNCSVTGSGDVPDSTVALAHNLEATQVAEWILGYEQRLGRWRAGVNFIHRNLLQTAEDAAIDAAVLDYCDANGVEGCERVWTGFHQYVVMNPGNDLTVNFYDAGLCEFGHPGRPDNPNTAANEYLPPIAPQPGVCGTHTFDAESLGYPKGKRKYTAVELMFDRPYDGVWSLGGSYTWSKSIGNSEGFVQSDFGQDDAGITQDFDQPGFIPGAYGLLPSHRRHRFKLYGAYTFWNSLTVGSNITVESPRPLSCFGFNPTDDFANVYGAASHYCGGVLSPRGTASKTGWYKNVDLKVAYKFGIATGQTIQLRADVFNVFNNKTVMERNEFGDLDVVYNAAGAISGYVPNPNYDLPTSYQAPRSVRLGLDVFFGGAAALPPPPVEIAPPPPPPPAPATQTCPDGSVILATDVCPAPPPPPPPPPPAPERG